MSNRHYSLVDEFLCKIDNGIKTLTVGANKATRVLPKSQNNITLEDSQRKHIAGLMRINHTGEICAQALYQGQALTAKDQNVRDAMQVAADEEIDHLVWCEDRLKELDSHTSYLGPIFYGLSFGIGALTGAISDKISLGFVEATEDQVCKHLQEHLHQVPESDEKTRAILAQMLIDEAHHAEMAIEQGGVEFPKVVKSAMTLLSKVMTKATYHI
jgi:ubiquinone biosynthesis monooxygenase Coq7